jgi:hypothetical protein
VPSNEPRRDPPKASQPKGAPTASLAAEGTTRLRRSAGADWLSC